MAIDDTAGNWVQGYRRVAVGVLLFVLVGAVNAAGNVLWVGNSRTYVGNLPEVYKALVLATDGRTIEAEMLVQGGGDIAGRVEDGSAAREILSGRYQHVLLQEHSSRASCAAKADSRRTRPCQQLIKAHRDIVGMARRMKLQVHIMGTHHADPDRAQQVLQGEAWLRQHTAADGHIPLARAYLAALEHGPQMQWVLEDGYHPHIDLTLLMAVLTYRQLHGQWPKPVDLALRYRSYSMQAFGADTTGSQQNLDTPLTERVVPAAHIERIIDLARKGVGK